MGVAAAVAEAALGNLGGAVVILVLALVVYQMDSVDVEVGQFVFASALVDKLAASLAMRLPGAFVLGRCAGIVCGERDVHRRAGSVPEFDVEP